MSDAIRLEVDTPDGHEDIIVSPDGQKQVVADLLRHQSLPLNTRCGHRGLCDGCLIELVKGKLVNSVSGAEVSANGHPVMLRGCEHRLVPGETPVIRIPPRSLLRYQPQVVVDFRMNVSVAHDPLWQQTELRLLRSGRHGALPVKFDGGLNPAAAPDSALATLEFRVDHWFATAISDTRDTQAVGIAIDIGTTTVAVVVINLLDGAVLGRAAGFNRQMHLGDDVLTRINLCSTDPSMVAKLQHSVVQETIAPLVAMALQSAGRTSDDVRVYTIAANTTMLHLFAGVDPSSMGVAPFTPGFLNHRILKASDVGLNSGNADPSIHLLPGAAAYIGADLTAGVFSSGLIYDDGPSLLVDIGTNGEIIFKHNSQMLGCATAAGPAFEGAGLESGMRAGDGAVAHVRFDREPFAVHAEVIGKERNVKPIGVCGSAYIDYLARARAAGVINEHGRIDLSTVPGAESYVIPWEEHGYAMRVAMGQGKHPVVISERDVSKLLQAKAAIAAGILTLIRRAGLEPKDVKTLYLAGGFGMHVGVPEAIASGLLPGFTPEQVQVVGNTSLAGAMLSMLDSGAAVELGKIGRQVEIIELNLDPEFEGTYIDHLTLP